MATQQSVQADALFSVKGMVAVITGGATGIGIMIAKALAANGASKIYLLARRKEKLDEAARFIGPDIVTGIECDVTSTDSLKAAAEHIRNEVGHIDLLVANSGVLGPRPFGGLDLKTASVQDIQRAVLDIPSQQIQDVYAVNVTGVYYTAFAFLDLLDAGNKQGDFHSGIGAGNRVKSQIVVVGSVAAYLRNGAGGFTYGTSKCAVTHLAKQLASFFVPHSIRVNVIAPGVFPSEMSEGAGLLAAANEGKVDINNIPAERFGDEFDMGGTLLYLSSRAGGFVSGNVLLIDGGRMNTTGGTY